jgi:hypothetical protein
MQYSTVHVFPVKLELDCHRLLRRNVEKALGHKGGKEKKKNESN